VSSAAAARDVSFIKAAINKARREEFTDFVPNFPRIAPAKPRNRWITAAEEDRLVEAAAPHLKPVIRFALDTGGRLSELLELDWRNVDVGARRVTFIETKNGDDRTVRLCERAQQTLRGLGPKDSGSVFTYNGKPFKDLKHAFTRARKIAGLDDVRFHDLRHTFASRLVQGGVPLFEVMHLTGHKSLSMVQRYAHLAPDFQEGAIRVLDERLETPGREIGHDLATVGKSHGVSEPSPMALNH